MRLTKDEAVTLIEAYGTLHGFWMMDRDGRGTCELDGLGELLADAMAGELEECVDVTDFARRMHGCGVEVDA